MPQTQSLPYRDLIELAAAKAGLTATDGTRMANALTEVITAHVAKGIDVRVAGFGTISRQRRAARTARIPATGEPLRLPARNAPTVRWSKKLRGAVEAGRVPRKTKPAAQRTPATTAPAKATRAAVKKTAAAPAKKATKATAAKSTPARAAAKKAPAKKAAAKTGTGKRK